MEFDELSYEHMVAIGVFLRKVANIDGMSAAEESLLDSFYADMEADVLALEQNPQWSLALVPPIRGLAFQMAYVVAHCDGDFTSAEEQFIAKIARGLGFSDAELANALKAAQNMLKSQIPEFIELDDIKKF